LIAFGIRVDFRVGGDLDLEVIAKVRAHQCHQFIGIDQLVDTHAGGHIAAQGDDMPDTCVLVGLDQFQHRLLAVAAK